MKVIKLHHQGAFRTMLLAKEGRRFVHCASITPTGVIKMSFPRDKLRHAEDVQLHGQPYPLDRALTLYKQAAQRRGITQGAKALLGVA